MLYLVAIAAAHAGPPGASADPQLIASIVAAVVTTLSGGGGLWWLRRNRVAGEGRDDQSARAKAAIARDNADQVMREVTAGYREDLAGLLAQLAEGGVLITPLADARGRQWLTRVQRQGDQFERRRLEPVRFVPLLEGVIR